MQILAENEVNTATAKVLQTIPQQNIRGVISGGQREFLSFQLGSEEYGIDILSVQEIRGYEAPTRMANAPAYIKGVLNLRGVIVPILDMRIRFGLAGVEYNAQTVTIILNLAERVVGMVVDAVSDVTAPRAEDIKPAPEFGGAVDTDYIIGISANNENGRERMLILMDIEQLMSSTDIGLAAKDIR